MRAVLRKYDLAFEERDITNDPRQRREMIERSGQTLSPCVEINGHLLADVSGEELEQYLLGQGLVEPTDRETGLVTHQCCGR